MYDIDPLMALSLLRDSEDFKYVLELSHNISDDTPTRKKRDAFRKILRDNSFFPLARNAFICGAYSLKYAEGIIEQCHALDLPKGSACYTRPWPKDEFFKNMRYHVWGQE